MNTKKPNAKARILKAANKVFAERGYSDATIADIAKTANTSEASVYQLFGGKEELFFAIPTEWIRAFLPLIEERLFGVKDALQRLRIFIWNFVRVFVEDRDYGRLILLHLKSNPSFQTTEAYKEVQHFLVKLTEIIELGQKSGEITPGINPLTARSIVLGSFEALLTRWFLKGCSYDLWPHIEEAYGVIEDVLREKPELWVHVTYGRPNGRRGGSGQELKRRQSMKAGVRGDKGGTTPGH